MKYCYTSTCGHKVVSLYPEIIKNISDILLRDGCVLGAQSPFYGEQNFVIDGDELENQFCVVDNRDRTTKNKSVDIIFVARDEIEEKKLVFVELKLNSRYPFTTLDKFSLRQKIEYSEQACGKSIPLYKNKYIVFQNDLPLAKHYLYRTQPILIKKDIVVVSTKDIFELFFK